MRKLKLNSNVITDGQCIIYVMSRDQRLQDNHAVIYAQNLCLELKLPLIIVFNILEKSGNRSREHYLFMLEGLKLIEHECQEKNITFVLTIGDAIKEITALAKKMNPQEIVFDFNPLKRTRNIQKSITSKILCASVVIDTHNIIPIWTLSDKEEYAAHTIRRKVHQNLKDWLVEPAKIIMHPYKLHIHIEENNWAKARRSINFIKSSGIKIMFKPGYQAGSLMLRDFIHNKLDNYAQLRNSPIENGQSNLSPYIHFGHISSMRVALNILKTCNEELLLFQFGKLASYQGIPSRMDSINAYIEELIVRKELADNFCFYNHNYDSLEGAKEWAKLTLKLHANDRRIFQYKLQDWQNASTHDLAWNAAQKELSHTGKMHGYMRMYWAKKILEWSESPELAIETAIYLNDFYSLDGGDPNGYAGIMWSIAGVHDRAWFERDVFGKIRYMNDKGLERKFNLEKYIQMWQ